MVCFVQALIFSRSVFTYGAVNSDADGKITGSVLFRSDIFEGLPAEHTLLFLFKKHLRIWFSPGNTPILILIPKL